MKKIKKMKKILLMTMIFFLAFSSAFIGTKANAQTNSSLKSALKQSLNKNKRLGKLNDLKKYKNTDKVRVIVELKGQPAIEYATKQGIRYKDLSKSKQDSLQADVKKQQTNFISDVKDKKINLKVENQFTTVVNGISGHVEYGKINELKKLPNVANVYITNKYDRPKVTPQMITSKDLIGAKETWNLKYKGDGMVVGVIDTGIDSSHKDMILSKDTKAKLTNASVNDIISKDKLPGKYFTEKVAYGYNYADKNNEIRDLGPDASMHGMHVAGTVAANGDEKNGEGIQGVSPESQLLALKVFGNDPAMPSTFGDIYIKAIDDGIKLGADVMNMSLGSTASFVDKNDPEQQAIKRAVDNGVLMSISAGNSTNIGGGAFSPLASNPDIGLVGAPSLSAESISVASFENTKMQVDALDYDIDGEKGSVAFLSASSVHPNDVKQKTFEVLAAGIGDVTDFKGKDFKGKFALVRRGTLDFATKALNAQEAGAAGVIVYNNQTGIVNMASDPGIKIPQLFMLQEDGDKLKAELDNGKSIKITFNGEKKEINNPSAGRMSDFTSWGVTPNLDFKPEITAPGGQIYSTLNNNQYGLMSGTSMAAPHVSGGAALVLEYMKQNDLFKNLTGAEKVEQAKTLLMNTAVPLVDPDVKTFYSPRREGAGLMKLDAAVTTPVYVTAKDTNAPKVNLKEITSNKFDFTLTLTNFSDQDVTYKVDTKPLTDYIGKDKNGVLLNAEAAQEIKNAKVLVDSEVTVSKGQSKDVTVSIDLSDADQALTALMKNGYFVEGFVTFKDVKDIAPSLSVPYLGFKGDWNQPPVLDAMVYDDEDSFYGVSGMIDENGYDLGFNPVKEEYSKNHIAFSPNGDGESDTITPILSFLRNSKTVEYSILDKDKKQIRKLNVDYDQRKNYYDASRPGSYYSYDPYTEWDGKANNKLVPDGEYYYQIKTQIDYAGKDPQVVQVPVIIDTKAPIINNLKYEKGVLSFNAADDGSGVNYFEIIVNGDRLGYLPGDVQKAAIPDLEDASIIVRAFDYAGNSATVTNEINDGTIPYLDPDTSQPEALGTYDTREVPFSGKIVAKAPIDKLEVRINTQEGNPYQVVKTHWNKEDATYDFNDTITFKEDGVHEIFVLGVDEKGNKLQFARKVFVDTTAPTIDVKGLPTNGQVDVNTDEVKITATIADNFDEIRFVMNGDLVEKNELIEPYEQRKYSKDVPLTLKLDKEPGENTFELQLTDLAGHVTTKVIKINKVVPIAPKVNPVSDKDTVVTGTASPNATILIKNGKTLVGANTVDKDGKFKVTLNSKQKAGTKLTVVVKIGEYESKATTVTVLDKTAPAAPTVNTVSDKDTKVTGKAEAGSKVTVKAGKTTLGTATADKSGKFTVKIKKQKAGTKLTVTATDKAGNVSKAKTVTVIDKTPPKAPTVNSVTGNTTKVTGKAEAGATITIKAGKIKIGSGKADKNGKFSVKIKKQKSGKILSVTATDKSGNVSSAKKVTVKTPVPTVNKITPSSAKVTGKSKAGTTVYVKSGSKTLGHAKANKAGKYTVKIKKQKAGTTLTVYAVENNRKSASKKVVVKK